MLKITSLVISAFISLQSYAASVASSSSDATQVAIKILKQGGNAFDAACAAFLAQGVTQSYFTGLGGGGFATIDRGGVNEFYDFREQAPSSTTPKLFSKIDPKADGAWSKRNTGAHSVGIPGNLAGCGMLHQKYGKLKWNEIVNPAIDLAKNGFTITQMYSEELGEQWKRISPFALTRSIYKGKNGDGLKKDETLKQPLLAATLERIAKEGPESLYMGKWAMEWTKEAKKLGVKVTPSDLKNYQVIKRTPVSFEFGKWKGVTAFFPSTATYKVGGALRFLQHFYSKHGTPDASSINRHIAELETFRAFAVVSALKVTDPKKMKNPNEKWLGSAQEKKMWADIERKILARMKKIGVNPSTKTAQITPQPKENSHTSNISVVDDFGNAIALTTSNGNVFGSGITVPKFGFLLSSTMGDFDMESGKLNSPAKGMRPRSDMSPTLLYEKQGNEWKLVASVGAAGGPLIPQSVVQFIQNYYVHGMKIEDAIAHPRVSISKSGEAEIEQKADAALIAQLKKAGYEISPTETIWAVLNATARKSATSDWEAVKESRYDGEAWVGSQK